MYSRRFVKFLSNPGVYELIPRPLCSFQESRRLSGSPGPLFHTPNWCLRLEMTLSAGFAILNHLKPMWSHPFTLRGIALKCTLASKKPVSTECLNEKLIHILSCRKREKIFKNAREVESYFFSPSEQRPTIPWISSYYLVECTERVKLKEINNHMNFHVYVLVRHLLHLLNICLSWSVYQYRHRWYD